MEYQPLLDIAERKELQQAKSLQDKRDAIARLRLSREQRTPGSRKKPVSEETISSLLFRLMDYLGNSAYCWPSQDRLAAEMKKSVRTVRDATNVLVQLKIVTVERRAHESSKHVLNHYSIMWGTLCDFGRIDEGRQTETNRQPDAPTGNLAQTNRQPDADQPATWHRPTGNLAQTNRQQVAAYVQGGTKESSSSRIQWSQVAAVLSELGVQCHSRAIDKAQASGATPEDCLAIAEHYRSHPGRWKPGQLYFRLLNALPDGDPAVGWPKGTQSDEPRRPEFSIMKTRIERAAQNAGHSLDDLEVIRRIRVARERWEAGEYDYA